VTTKTRCVAYARFSTKNQDARSIEDQLRRCRKYADEHGYQLVGEFTDAAVSGKRFETRVGVQRLLAEARRP
jgi:DNA invertase Pin-like site-specific DNA recombinase